MVNSSKANIVWYYTKVLTRTEQGEEISIRFYKQDRIF